MVKGFRVWGLCFMVSDSGFKGFGFDVSGLEFRGVGFRVQGAGFRVEGCTATTTGRSRCLCRVLSAGCRVQGAGCRVQGAGCRVQGSGVYCDDDWSISMSVKSPMHLHSVIGVYQAVSSCRAVDLTRCYTSFAHVSVTIIRPAPWQLSRCTAVDSQPVPTEARLCASIFLWGSTATTTGRSRGLCIPSLSHICFQQ